MYAHARTHTTTSAVKLQSLTTLYHNLPRWTCLWKGYTSTNMSAKPRISRSIPVITQLVSDGQTSSAGQKNKNSYVDVVSTLKFSQSIVSLHDCGGGQQQNISEGGTNPWTWLSHMSSPIANIPTIFYRRPTYSILTCWLSVLRLRLELWLPCHWICSS